MFELTPKSLVKLIAVDQRLAAVVKLAIELSSVNFIVVEGLRSQARQAELYAQGRTTPGKIVTWVKHSKHQDGLAVDLAPFENGTIDWNNEKKFDAIKMAMFAAAAELQTTIRWGANWDGDDKPREKGESDSPHFELVD